MRRSGLKLYTRFAVLVGFAAALPYCALSAQPEPASGPLNPQPEPPARGKDGGTPGVDGSTEPSDAAERDDAAASDASETGAAATPRTVARAVDLLNDLKRIALTPTGHDGGTVPSAMRPRLTLDEGAQR